MRLRNYMTYALRNLTRHKTKTVITVISVAIGIAFYIFLDGLMYGTVNSSKLNIINFETGSLKIYSRDYFAEKEDLPLSKGFFDYEEIIETLRESGYYAAGRATFTGTLINSNGEIPYKFVGIDPDAEKQVFLTDDYFVDGRYPDEFENGIVVGAKGAMELGLRVGSRVKLNTTIESEGLDGRMRSFYQRLDLTVTGIINTPDPALNDRLGFINLSVLDDETGIMLDGMITEIVIRKMNADVRALPGYKESSAYVGKILGKKLSDDLVLISYMEDARDLIEASNQDYVSSYFMIILFIILVILGNTNTMLMAVFERKREIGMLRAIGMRDGEIISMFMLESALLGGIGAVLGVILGVLINIYMVNVGIDISAWMDNWSGTFGYRIVAEMKSGWNPAAIILSVFLMTFFCWLVAYVPAKGSMRCTISENLME